MEPWMWAIIIKPFALVAFFFLVALIALPIKRLGSPRNILFDPTLRQRRPFLFGSIVIVVWVGIIAVIAVITAQMSL